MVNQNIPLFSNYKTIPTGGIFTGQGTAPIASQQDVFGTNGLNSMFPTAMTQPVTFPQFPKQIGTTTPITAADSVGSTNTDTSLKTILSLLLVILSAVAKGKSSKATEKNHDRRSETHDEETQAAKGESGGKVDRKGAQAADDASPPKGKGNTGIADGKGWAKNVNVFASSNAQEESIGVYSNDQLVGGYTAELGRQMDEGKTLKQAHDDVKLDTQTPMRNHANDNSLVPGKGGKAVVVTGDGINKKEADQFAEKLRKNYGMDVEVIGDASPNQLKASIEKMGKEGGEQCMVAVLAHGAKDGSGQNKGNMALGKGDGDQWLSEDLLQSMVNDNLANSFDNVNVVVSSCYGGNYVE